MKSFQIYNFKDLLDKPACYNNPTNPSCVDVILTSRPRSFQNSFTFETKLSDFYKMMLTVPNSSFAKQKPKVKNYCNYKFFNNTLFRDQVFNKLRYSNLQINDKGLKNFKETCLTVINTIALLKSKSSKSGTLHKQRNSTGCYAQVKTKKKILKSRSENDKKAYNKQRNKCISLLWKTKKSYYSNLNRKDNKKFWKTIKSFIL